MPETHKTRPQVTVVDHPLVQHKLTIMRNKETSTASFRRLLREISLLLCYEVTRDLELTTTQIETPLQPMEAPTLEGKKLVFASMLRAGNGLLEGMLDLVPAARVAHIGLYRDHDTLRGRGVLLQGAAGPGRPAGDRRRSDAGHRQFGHCGGRPAEAARRHQSALPVPACRARGHQALHHGPPRRAGRSPQRSTAISTRRATSCRALAMPATACTAPSNATLTGRAFFRRDKPENEIAVPVCRRTFGDIWHVALHLHGGVVHQLCELRTCIAAGKA